MICPLLIIDGERTVDDFVELVKAINMHVSISAVLVYELLNIQFPNLGG